MNRATAQQKAEAELTAFGLSLPEISIGPGWATTRVLKVRSRMFPVFGDRNEQPNELTIM